MAFHYEQAGDTRALIYLLQAAEQAESFFALPHATQLLTRALTFQEQYWLEQPQSREYPIDNVNVIF